MADVESATSMFYKPTNNLEVIADSCHDSQTDNEEGTIKTRNDSKTKTCHLNEKEPFNSTNAVLVGGKLTTQNRDESDVEGRILNHGEQRCELDSSDKCVRLKIENDDVKKKEINSNIVQESDANTDIGISVEKNLEEDDQTGLELTDEIDKIIQKFKRKSRNENRAPQVCDKASTSIEDDCPEDKSIKSTRASMCTPAKSCTDQKMFSQSLITVTMNTTKAVIDAGGNQVDAQAAVTSILSQEYHGLRDGTVTPVRGVGNVSVDASYAILLNGGKANVATAAAKAISSSFYECGINDPDRMIVSDLGVNDNKDNAVLFGNESKESCEHRDDEDLRSSNSPSVTKIVKKDSYETENYMENFNKMNTNFLKAAKSLNDYQNKFRHNEDIPANKKVTKKCDELLVKLDKIEKTNKSDDSKGMIGVIGKIDEISGDIDGLEATTKNTGDDCNNQGHMKDIVSKSRSTCDDLITTNRSLDSCSDEPTDERSEPQHDEVNLNSFESESYSTEEKNNLVDNPNQIEMTKTEDQLGDEPNMRSVEDIILSNRSNEDDENVRSDVFLDAQYDEINDDCHFEEEISVTISSSQLDKYEMNLDDDSVITNDDSIEENNMVDCRDENDFSDKRTKIVNLTYKSSVKEGKMGTEKAATIAKEITNHKSDVETISTAYWGDKIFNFINVMCI